MDCLPPPSIKLLVYSPTAYPFHAVLSTLLARDSEEPQLAQSLAPKLFALLQARAKKPATYSQLLGLTQLAVQSLPLEEQAYFLSRQPRIGEGRTAHDTDVLPDAPGEVLKRLTILNSFYEESFPGLRFVTWVNSRPKSEIVPEIEKLLGLKLPPPSGHTPEPSLSSLRSRSVVRITGSSAWREELARGLEAVFAIANARLQLLGVE